MKNKQKYLDELNNILPDYLEENISFYSEISPQNFIEISERILQLISLQKYHPEAKKQLINLCEQLNEIEERIPYDYCLFTGRMRVIYTFLKVFESLKAEKYLEFSKSFFVKEKVIDYAMSSQNNNGIFKGKIGTLLGLLYIKKHIPQLELDDVVDFIFNEIIKNIVIDKHGLCNFYQESHKGTLTDLANGNAGLIWFFTTLSQTNSTKEIEKITQSLLQSLNAQWSSKCSNWKDNTMKMSSINDYFFYTEQFKNVNLTFFKSPKNNYDFWEGSLGICVSLVNYLLNSTQKNDEILAKVETNLAIVEEKRGKVFKHQNVKNLYYLYISLYKITNNTKYVVKINKLVENSKLKKATKVSLIMSILNNYDAEELDILPTLNNLEYFSKDLLMNIQKSLIFRYYSQTIALLNFLQQDYFDSNFIQTDSELNVHFFKNFDSSFKNSAFIRRSEYKKMLMDSFKREQFIRKKITKHQNKIFLKVQDIVQFSQADEILNLDESALNLKEFIVIDNVYVLTTKWNWSHNDKITLDEIFKKPSDSHYELIKIKPIDEQKISVIFSENQLILLELFYENISIKDAKRLFFDSFNINSEIEYNDLLSFVDKTIEQFIFNRFIFPK